MLGLIVVVLGWALLLRGVRHLRWRLRRRRLVPRFSRAGPGALVCRCGSDCGGACAVAAGALLVAWEELSEQLALSGLRRRAGETPAAWAKRAAVVFLPGGAAGLDELGVAFSRVAYGDWAPSPRQLDRLERAAQEAGRQALRSRRRWARLAGWFDPRAAWKPVLVDPAIQRAG